MKRTRLICGLAIVLSLALLSMAMAAATPVLERSVLGSAGQPVEQDGLTLNGTLGEPVAGPLVIDSEAQVASGYWQKLPGDYVVFLPMIDR